MAAWQELKNLPNLFRRRSARENSPISHAISGSAAATAGMYGSAFSTASGGWDVQRAVNEGLERVVWVFRCCDAIASNQAKLKMVLRRGDPLDGRIEDDARLFKLLNRKPNSHETAQDFRYRLSVQLLLSKRGAFIEVVRDALGRPKALELLPPHLVEPIPDASTFVGGYRLLNQVTLEEIVLPRSNVIWVRLKPHPIDPYLQLTPLTAAGLIVDTEWLSRLFNRNFLVNDGRPGMLVAIRGRLNTMDAEEIKRRFTGGPQNAGRTTVVEADDVNAQDLSATPRDLQWLEALKGAKEDILLAFGTPESVLGNASGRTFDNADAEMEGWWEQTMTTHVNGMCRGLDALTGDDDDDLFVGVDYDQVDVLQRRKKERHQKLLEEYQAGTLTLDEYLVGVGRKRLNIPASRVYFHTSGIVIGDDADVKAVAKLPIIGQPPQLGGYPGADQGGFEDEEGFGNQQQIEGNGFANKSFAQRTNQLTSRAAALHIKATVGRPTPPLAITSRIYGVDEAGDTVEGDLPVAPAPDWQQRAEEPDTWPIEAQFHLALKGWDALQAEVITGRLSHAKLRKHTRHWVGEGQGDKALDPQHAVEIRRWQQDLVNQMLPLMQRTAGKVARQTAKEMVQTGIANVMHARGVGDPRSRTALGRVFGSTHTAEQAVRGVLGPLEIVVREAARRHSQRVIDTIREMDRQGASISQIQRAVRSEIGTRAEWRRQLARYLTTAITEGVKADVYAQAGDLVVKRWNTREDERVRATHRRLNGKEISVGKKFRVGKYFMDRPMDPRGGIEECVNCRCFLTFDINPRKVHLYESYA